MKKRSTLFVSVLTLTLVSIFSINCSRGKQDASSNCTYKDYKGTVSIVSVESDPNSSDTMGVNYTFLTDDTNAPKAVKEIHGTISIPKPVIEKRDVRKDKQFKTKASYIENGSCDPGPTLDNFYNWQ